MDPAVETLLSDFVAVLIGIAVVIWIARRLWRIGGRVARGTGSPAAIATTSPGWGRLGSWSGLEAKFAVPDGPSEPVATRASLMIGPTIWRNCVRVGIEPLGLRLAIRIPILGSFGRKPLLIPWSAFVGDEPATLFWRSTRRLRIGEPPLATLTPLPDLLDLIVRSGRLEGAAPARPTGR